MCVVWLEKAGSEGVELRLVLQSSPGADVGDVQGFFPWLKQSWFYWDGRSTWRKDEMLAGGAGGGE